MTDRCKANPCCGNMGVGCDIPLPQDDSGFPGRNKQFAEQIKAGATSVAEAINMTRAKESESEAALVVNGVVHVANGVVHTEKPKDTGDNFLTLMTEMAGVVGRFRERIVAEGQTFAKDFATLAPYMEGLSSTQEQVFLSAFVTSMQEANQHMQKVVGATFEAL